MHLKSTTYLFFIFGLLFSSCVKDSPPVENQLVDAKTLQVYSTLKNAVNRGQQIQLFDQLTAKEKTNIWKYKFGQLDKNKFTKAQQLLIDELSSYVNIEFYISGTEENVSENWIDQARLHFSDDEIRSLAFSMSSFSPKPTPVPLVYCQCVSAWWDCAATEYCDWRPDCTVWRACGFLWGGMCMGLCHTAPAGSGLAGTTIVGD